MITYSESFLTFLANSDCKVAKLLHLAHLAHEDRLLQPSYKLFVTNSQIDYVTFRTDGTISYLPAGKKHQTNEDGTWRREGRQNGKPGKVIAKLFTKNALKVLHVKEFECFTNEYKAEYNGDDYTFSIRSNKQVPKVYEMQRAAGGGTLNDSCMNNDSEYLDIYKYCPQLSILTLTDKDDKLNGRALVWKISDELTIMDRIYVVKDFMYDMFLNYARSKNWYHKKHYKSYDHKTSFVSPDGTEKELSLTINTKTEFDSYPYIDTFSYGDYGSLFNYEKGCYQYNGTNGTREDGNDEEDNHEDEAYDEIDQCYINNEDAIEITRGRYRHHWTHSDNTVDINGNTWWIRDNEIIELDGEWYHCDDVVYCEKDDGGDHLRSECVEINEDWYHEDSDLIVKIDGEYYLKTDENIECVEGEYRLIETVES